jgi:ubiquinone/menaquinone biosynthesis C-methylase UbiE
MMRRTPEPELMTGEEQVLAYAWADFRGLHPVMIARFQERFPDFRRGRLLDLGCGAADMTIRFAQAFPEIQALAVDGSEPMLRHAAEKTAMAGFSDRIELRRRMLPDGELEKGEFDAVITNSVLHHFSDPMALWRTVVRCVKAGGPVMTMDLRRPRSEDDVQALVTKYASEARDVLRRDFFNSLRAAYTILEVRRQLDASGLSGFRVEEIGDCQLVVWGVASETGGAPGG